MLIRNPRQIEIPPYTLIAVCGLPRSGKTYFVERTFYSKSIISTEKTLEIISTDLLSITEHDLNLKPKDEDFEKIRKHLSRVAWLKSAQIVEELVQVTSNNQPYVVLDSVSYKLSERIQNLKSVADSFDHVYLVCLNSPIEILLQRPEKKLVKSLEDLKMSPISDKQIEMELVVFQNELRHMEYGVEKVFLMDDDNFSVKIV